MEHTFALEITWVAIHLVGLIAAWMVRQEATASRQALAQSGFFACLPLIALLTILGQVYCLDMWPLSAGTLGAMIVTAVVDFGPRTS
ncbi:hypothetical protein [Bythopirellula polymerisocia]|uniref:Uncharacterized protein n=1 Tax=Bythopirellula polymerisocia TaxID=2528003 RepID=A0A5C6CSK0_9BACT|nr:hypothetical protein [Bythopirellula polymerisocia]TWU27530.1 hypothetical protein Pla144_23060 [Bythopirellula polymerisocia]